MSSLTDFYIKQLEEDKADLERQIEELRQQVSTINTLIYRRKSRSLADNREEKVSKKNVDRLFYESLVLDILSSSGQGMKTSQIFDKVEKMGFRLNYNTFRAYISDMRKKNMIAKRSPSSPFWKVIS